MLAMITSSNAGVLLQYVIFIDFLFKLIGIEGTFQRQCIRPKRFLSMKIGVMASRSTEIFGKQDETKLYSFLFQYETPKVVTIQSVPLGILRVTLQTIVIGFVFLYQLWYSQGYQEFAEGEMCVTAKVKGFSM